MRCCRIDYKIKISKRKEERERRGGVHMRGPLQESYIRGRAGERVVRAPGLQVPALYMLRLPHTVCPGRSTQHRSSASVYFASGLRTAATWRPRLASLAPFVNRRGPQKTPMRSGDPRTCGPARRHMGQDAAHGFWKAQGPLVGLQEALNWKEN